MRPVVSITVLAILVVMLTAIARSEAWHGGDPIIDSWPVGPVRDCADDQARCEDEIRVALAALDVRDSTHPPVAGWSLHVEGNYFDARTRKRILWTRSGGRTDVLVVHYASGGDTAIGVGYPGVATSPVPLQYEQRP